MADDVGAYDGCAVRWVVLEENSSAPRMVTRGTLVVSRAGATITGDVDGQRPFATAQRLQDVGKKVVRRVAVLPRPQGPGPMLVAFVYGNAPSALGGCLPGCLPT